MMLKVHYRISTSSLQSPLKFGSVKKRGRGNKQTNKNNLETGSSRLAIQLLLKNVKIDSCYSFQLLTWKTFPVISAFRDCKVSQTFLEAAIIIFAQKLLWKGWKILRSLLGSLFSGKFQPYSLQLQMLQFVFSFEFLINIRTAV